MTDPQRKRLDLRLDDSDHRSLKIVAAARGISIQRLVERLIRDELERERSRALVPDHA